MLAVIRAVTLRHRPQTARQARLRLGQRQLDDWPPPRLPPPPVPSAKVVHVASRRLSQWLMVTARSAMHASVTISSSAKPSQSITCIDVEDKDKFYTTIQS